MLKNYMAIHDVRDDEAARAYTSYFREMYANTVAHGEWTKNTSAEFATAIQVWQGSNSNFYCTHFQAVSEDHVYKQLDAWGMDHFFNSMVMETNRFTSALLPKMKISTEPNLGSNPICVNATS